VVDGSEVVHKLDEKYLPKLIGKSLEGEVINYHVPFEEEIATAVVGKGAEIFNSYELDEFARTYPNVAIGDFSHAEGHRTYAIGDNSHSEGT